MIANRSMPASTVIPVLAYNDVAAAVDWLCLTFGFRERWRAGSHRAQLAVGDGAVAVTERRDAGSASHGCPSVMVPGEGRAARGRPPGDGAGRGRGPPPRAGP